MVFLLTFAAVVMAMILLVGATGTGARATKAERRSRGPWGIASWQSVRNRPLNPHERRWQTAMLASKDNTSRWRDLVAELDRLESTSQVAPHSHLPDRYDAKWIEARIAALEAAASKTAPTGDQTQ